MVFSVFKRFLNIKISRKKFSKLFTTPYGTKNSNYKRSILAGFVVHATIGSIYTFSLFNKPLNTNRGVVAQTSRDWTLQDTTRIFSATLFFHALSSFVLKKWQTSVGPRLPVFLSACIIFSGFSLASIGVFEDYYYLTLFGYGFLYGTGIGLAYVPVLSICINSFPKNIGLVSGIISCGFGGSALLQSWFIQRLLSKYSKPPLYLGKESEVETIIDRNGRILVSENDSKQTKEVVVADKQTLNFYAGKEDLSPGVYEIKTGSSGVSKTFFVLGCIYFVLLASSAFVFIRPQRVGYVQQPFFKPQKLSQKGKFFSNLLHFFKDKLSTTKKFLITHLPKKLPLSQPKMYVDYSKACKTSQFYCLFTIFLCLSSIGMIINCAAKDMVEDIFAPLYKEPFQHSFGVKFLSILSFANLFGRIFWATLSDSIGKKNTVYLMFGTGLIFSVLIIINQFFVEFLNQSQNKNKSNKTNLKENFSLTTFVISSSFLIFIFGGAYSTIPAYATKVFGKESINNVHGTLILASGFASLLGPQIVSFVKNNKEMKEIRKLSKLVNENSFKDYFGVEKKELENLIQSKAVTIKKIIGISPGWDKRPIIEFVRL